MNLARRGQRGGAVEHRRSQAGFTFLEIVIAVALISIIVISVADGMVTFTRSKGESNDSQRVDAVLTSAGETLRQIKYTKCADPGWYEQKLQDRRDALAVADQRVELGVPKGYEVHVESVKYWSLGSFPATGTTTPGQFVSTCGTDTGLQLLKYQVTYRGKTFNAEISKRDPQGLGFEDFSTTSAPPAVGHNPPTARIVLTPSSGAAPLNVTLDGSQSSAQPPETIVSWVWTFDDGSGQAAGSVLQHTFQPGTFLVRLTVTDSKGSSASTSKTISVSGKPAAPTNLRLVRSGCCNTYATFAWNGVPGVSEYQIHIEYCLLWNCDWQIGPSWDAYFVAPAGSGTVSQFGLALGSKYQVKIRARVGSNWSDWSSTKDVTL